MHLIELEVLLIYLFRVQYSFEYDGRGHGGYYVMATECGDVWTYSTAAVTATNRYRFCRIRSTERSQSPTSILHYLNPKPDIKRCARLYVAHFHIFTTVYEIKEVK